VVVRKPQTRLVVTIHQVAVREQERVTIHQVAVREQERVTIHQVVMLVSKMNTLSLTKVMLVP
jgi:hypothetical protein